MHGDAGRWLHGGRWLYEGGEGYGGEGEACYFPSVVFDAKLAVGRHLGLAVRGPLLKRCVQRRQQIGILHFIRRGLVDLGKDTLRPRRDQRDRLVVIMETYRYLVVDALCSRISLPSGSGVEANHRGGMGLVFGGEQKREQK